MVELPEPFVTPDHLTRHQATHALGGFVYQIYASALAWLALEGDDQLLLEIAEDYACLAEGVLTTVQVRNTAGSGGASLNAPGVTKAIQRLWELARANPEQCVRSVYLSTSTAVRERPCVLPAGATGLGFWAQCDGRSAGIALIREQLLTSHWPAPMEAWIRQASDADLYEGLLSRMTWRLGEPGLNDLSARFHRSVALRCSLVGLLPAEVDRTAHAIFMHVLRLASQAGARTLDRLDLDQVVQAANLVLARAQDGRAGYTHDPYSPPLDPRTRDDDVGRLFFFGAADRTRFIGREGERELLEGWANRSTDFSWTLVTGVGGMGKSRLALEIIQELAAKGWHAGFLGQHSELSRAKRFSEFQPQRPTLIVIDYVSLNPDWAGDILRTLVDASTIKPFAHPVRVLLLERTGAATPWFHDMTRSQQSRLMGRAAILGVDNAFLSLGRLHPLDRWALFCAVACASGDVDARRLRACREDIAEALDRIDPHGTPLFTALAAEAMRAGREIWQFDRKALLNDIFLRERARWEHLARDQTDLARHERACALATMVGGLSIHEAAGCAASPAFPFDAERYNRDLVEAINGPAPSPTQIAALEPDILGEWFVLRCMRSDNPFDTASEDLRAAAAALAVGAPQLTWSYAGFRTRLAQDFPDLAIGSRLYEPPPPDAPVTEQASWVGLLSGVIEDLSEDKEGLKRLYNLVLSIRADFPLDQTVQINSLAAIGVYATQMADADAIGSAAELITTAQWPLTNHANSDGTTNFSRAALLVGRALARGGDPGTALRIFDLLRRHAIKLRRVDGQLADNVRDDAAQLGLHIRAAFFRMQNLQASNTMNQILWRQAGLEGRSLAVSSAQILASIGDIEDLELSESVVDELKRRSAQRADAPAIAVAAAQALFTVARDEIYALGFLDAVQDLASWLAPRLHDPDVRKVLATAIQSEFLDETLNLGAEALETAFELWQASRLAAFDADVDWTTDPQVVQLGEVLERGLGQNISDSRRHQLRELFRSRAKRR